jgi:beta-xylosidase
VNITNPILRGCNPDPSILRVGNDYYIATSTFEWYPGVQIHHVKNLAHWRFLPNFTGAFAGVCCQDGAGTRRPADFDYFEYHERGYQPQPALQ